MCKTLYSWYFYHPHPQKWGEGLRVSEGEIPSTVRKGKEAKTRSSEEGTRLREDGSRGRGHVGPSRRRHPVSLASACALSPASHFSGCRLAPQRDSASSKSRAKHQRRAAVDAGILVTAQNCGPPGDTRGRRHGAGQDASLRAQERASARRARLSSAVGGGLGSRCGPYGTAELPHDDSLDFKGLEGDRFHFPYAQCKRQRG